MTEPITKPIVELRNVYKSFPDARNGKRIEAVRDVSLTIPKAGEPVHSRVTGEDNSTPQSEFVVFLGPSGCGKSTILNMISGMLPLDAGDIRVCGSLVLGPNADSATVPQAYTCFPWLTVQQNVEFGLAIKGKNKRERTKIAKEYLKKVGLGNRPNARPRQLSGGMQQRVAIARTLAIQPRVVLMDEPFGALDAQTRTDMQDMLIDLWKAEQSVIIFVTHDINEALLLGDRIIVFSPSPAHIVKDYPVTLSRPRDIYDQDFIRQSRELLNYLQSGSSHSAPQIQEAEQQIDHHRSPAQTKADFPPPAEDVVASENSLTQAEA